MIYCSQNLKPVNYPNHDYTYGLAKYRGGRETLVTGSWKDSDCSIKTEIYNFEADQWHRAPDYPFAT